MEPKDFQIKTLNRVKSYLGHLYELEQKHDKVIAQIGEDAGFDFAAKAWEKVEPYKAYRSKKDGLKRPLPNFCLKIPTGGGKTFLAVKVIDLINTLYLKKQTGLVLWVVPTTQIYRQTLKSLRNREHPYRQHLDIASSGRTKIVEKTERFSKKDVEENLVVLLLMLQSAGRKNKEVLKVFKDSEGFGEFFPAEDDFSGNEALLKKISNLDAFEKSKGFWGTQVKTSLGNTLRMLNPILILDEGHKAYSEIAQDTLRGFNPSIIVELSATPVEGSNILVEITGLELSREDMIKLDLHIHNKASVDWKDTLLASYNHLQLLTEKAREYEANTGKHIRPICLIQAERTGKAQRGAGKIHSEDVREQLINVLGIPAEEIAVKTSEKDELKDVDDIGGLMSKDCRIKYIITKQALQEGWDCSFAYVLAVLTKPGSKNALTQLVGRILRQPFAKKTQIKELDESYVFCFQQKGGELLEDIRKGLKGEGLGDLTGRITLEEGTSEAGKDEEILEVKEKFSKAVEEIILPIFVVRDSDEWRKVNYEMDIASRVNWSKVQLEKLFDTALSFTEQQDEEQVAGLSENVHEVIKQKSVTSLRKGGLKVDLVFLTRQLSDIVPNPWMAFELGQKVLGKLTQKYGDEMVANNFVFIIEETKKHLTKEKDRLSEGIFRDMIDKEELRFLVIANKLGFRLPKKRRIKRGTETLNKKNGRPLAKTLFDIEPKENFNNLEKDVAWYLDEQEKLFFWYRNAVKQDYSVQGWQKNKIYADFIFADVDGGTEQFNRVFVVETKGIPYKGSEDTDYKRKVFKLCNETAKQMSRTELGLKLKQHEISFNVIDKENWQQRLNMLLN
jgi:type III restriction enzyme